MAINVRCKKHPKYKGMRDPKVECSDCATIRDIRVHYPQMIAEDQPQIIQQDVPLTGFGWGVGGWDRGHL